MSARVPAASRPHRRSRFGSAGAGAPYAGRALSASLVFALAWIAAPMAHATGTDSDEAALAPSTDPVLTAIESLESRRDAKCHSSANRFEDFLFGTPLSAEAREVHEEAKQRVARRLWSAASASAAAAGRERVDAADVDRRASELVDGRVRITYGDGDAIEIDGHRLEQYSSIAYSLRAILTVDQDQFLRGGDRLLPLTEPGVGALSRALDLLSLAALDLADREARGRNEYELTTRGVTSAWARIAPPGATVAADDPGTPRDPAEVRARSLACARPA